MIKLRKNKPHTGLGLYIRERLLWWRHAGWFAFAHKPLCDHYKHDTFAFSGFKVCRSCTLVYSGFFLTLLLTFMFTPLSQVVGWLTLFVIGVTSILSYPPLYKHHSRGIRDLLRSGLGISIALTLSLLISGLFLFAGLAILALAGFWIIFGKLRQTTKRSRCHACPEYDKDIICSGYHKQSASIRNYEIALEAMIRSKQNTVPSTIAKKLKESHQSSNTD